MNKNLFCMSTLYEHNGCKRPYEQQFQKRGRFNKTNNLDATTPFYTNRGKTTKVITDLKKASMKWTQFLKDDKQKLGALAGKGMTKIWAFMSI